MIDPSFDASGTVPLTVPSPFSAFRNASVLRDAGLTLGDLHDGATPGAVPLLRHWMMGHPAVRCTTLAEIRIWIARRRDVRAAELDPWVRDIVAASDWDEMIARACA